MSRILLGLQSVVLVFLLKTGISEGELKTYGNPVTARTTSGSDQRISPSGPRIWIDDPLNGDSWPQWGYLQLFSVYIAPTPSTAPLPGVYLQLWSNTSMINNYTLKWQRRLESYQMGRSYQIAPEPGVVVEVSNYDRLGFTCDGSTCPVALDFEEDDAATASRAHRTYFRLLSRDGNALPVVGDYRLTDNNALRGRFSIAVTLDNAPPRKSTEVYVGNELIRRPKVGTFGNSSLLDDSIVFPTGRLTAFYFRLDQLTASTSVQVNIWFPVPGSNDQYVSVYTRSVTLGPNNKEKTYNLSITDGPLVNSSVRIGWTTDKIFFSSGSGSCRQLSESSGQVYTFDRLPYSYAASIGAIVDVQQLQPTSTTSSSTSSSKPVTSQFLAPTTPSVNPVTSSSYGTSSSSSSPATSSSTSIRVTSWPYLITSSSDRSPTTRSTGKGNGNGNENGIENGNGSGNGNGKGFGNGNGSGNGSTSSRLRRIPIALFLFFKFFLG